MIRKAVVSDLDQVERCLTEFLAYEQTHDAYTSWRLNVYPTRQTAAQSLSEGSLYVMERDGEIDACLILSRNQPPKFDLIEWRRPAGPDEVMVVGLLCVRPSRARRGLGTAMVRFAIEEARQANCRTVRLDTGERNAPAQALYTRIGFTCAGSHHGYLFYEYPI